LNQGASFTILLPVCAEAQKKEIKPFFGTKAAQPLPAKPEKPAFKIRALLVEDNDDSREMLKALLEQYGIETFAVESAAKAYAEISRNPPDILISDVGMPGEDGFELIKKIRQLPPENGGNVPAIALTGYVSRQDRAHALSIGYQEHLAKPVDTEKLLELVKNFVSKDPEIMANGKH
jgi:CheY-like chemotaxis protein